MRPLGVLLATTTAPTYSVQFPSAGNFKFVCLAHADMTGLVHVLDLSENLPHDQDFYDQQAEKDRVLLLADASRLRSRGTYRDGAHSSGMAAGVGEIVTMTGAGSQTASLMRFGRGTIVVGVGDTVEWTSLDPSINHTVTFGDEPADPRPPSANVMPTSDGAQASGNKLTHGQRELGISISCAARSGEARPIAPGCNAISGDLHISRHLQLHLCRS